ncbi:MAG: response regulator [Chloroflexota bacterium]
MLVIDDDEAIRAFVSHALQDEGYVVFATASAGAALDFLWQCWDDQPDAILLDVYLPGINGQTFAEAYHLLPVPHAPIVLMTAAQDAGEYADQIHAEGVLTKPFELHDLLARLYHTTARPSGRAVA